MLFDHIMIRFGEISTKGKNRRKFIDSLLKNIRDVLSEHDSLRYQGTRDRIYIKLHGENHELIAEKLSHVFGIQSYSLAVKAEKDISVMKDAALSAVKSIYRRGDTFKVSTRRADKTFPLDTNEINYQLGSHILVNTEELSVDLHKPDINLRVEVREDAVYFTAKDYKGAGGLPAGTSGKAMLLLSGGIDSPVAGYLSLKRGLEIEAVHFFSPPYTSEKAKQKVVDLTNELVKFGGKMVLHIVPFTEIQELIQKQIPENYTMTSTRRMMLKITDAIREKNGGLAIVTGESLGQVASQTTESMYAINGVTSTPVLRPLIAMDKLDIIEIAQKIGTHDISVQPFEDCCTIFTPAAPKTRPKKEKAERFESFVNFEDLIEKAVEKTETITIDKQSSKTQESFSQLF
ncbi:tRNA 4-thiouridine(8) synthase ThiI [Bacillus lacus]|uniref:Probable tRNA sulfurtransferase n=1 Tax=Metabacillus lacus TaxID=1983721 RepID=A0A7X2LXP0_9BACI|nr:tRNA uracil 4-sulfurtransferase ThiI [Metabacillus lacus]MRX72755.1 tRNA 4-thiouridine(8) synthase ThiI [Metabacillus lacus]